MVTWYDGSFLHLRSLIRYEVFCFFVELSDNFLEPPVFRKDEGAAIEEEENDSKSEVDKSDDIASTSGSKCIVHPGSYVWSNEHSESIYQAVSIIDFIIEHSIDIIVLSRHYFEFCLQPLIDFRNDGDEDKDLEDSKHGKG